MARVTLKMKNDDGSEATLDVDPVLSLTDQNGTKHIDFSKALPMTQGDWLQLDKSGVVVMRAGDRKVNLSEPQRMLDFVAHFARKADPSIGPMDLLPVPMARILKIASFLQHKALEDEALSPS